MVGCFIVHCNSGLAAEKFEKISYFHPPKNCIEKWKKAIPKRNLELTTKSVICSKHFRSEQILWDWTSGEGENKVKIRLQRPKLAQDVVPTIFPKECSPSCVPRVLKERNAPKLRATVATKTSTTSRTKPKVMEESLADENLDEFCPPIAQALSPFNTWESFSCMGLPNTESWSMITIGETRSLVEHALSDHIERQVVVVRELRTMKNKNSVQSFALGIEFGALETILSSEELERFAKRFFELSICQGIPSSTCHEVKSMKHGFRNVLNRWQSTTCQKQIDAGSAMCSECSRLNSALTMKIRRISPKINPHSLTKPAAPTSQKLYVTHLSPRKKQSLRRSMGTITKAKRRLQYIHTTCFYAI